MLFGVAGFFAPRVPAAPFQPPGTLAAISYYDTEPLRRRSSGWSISICLNARRGAAFGRRGQRRRTATSSTSTAPSMRIDARHIMASGALPPGFPPVEIDGEFYWDGGIVSNTPLQYVLDEPGRRSRLVFQVDLFAGARRDAGHARPRRASARRTSATRAGPASTPPSSCAGRRRCRRRAPGRQAAGEPARRSRREGARRAALRGGGVGRSTSSIAASTTRASRRTTSSRAHRCSSTGPPASPTRRPRSRIRAGSGGRAAAKACTCSTSPRLRQALPTPSPRPPASKARHHHEQAATGQDRHRHGAASGIGKEIAASMRARAPRSRSPT